MYCWGGLSQGECRAVVLSQHKKDKEVGRKEGKMGRKNEGGEKE